MLAGGYWGQAEKIYEKVDPDLDRENRGVDYVIRIKGLPDRFLPADEKKVIKYFCETCKKAVPEWEVENKVGCFALHRCVQQISAVKDYPGYLYSPIDSERAKKKKFLSDGFIVWVNNPEGVKIVQKIFRYAQSRIPKTEKMPSPVPLGTKNGFIIEDKEEIPLVDISESFEEMQAATTAHIEATVGFVRCPHCDKMLKNDYRGFRMHIMQAHKDIFEKKYQGKGEEVLKAVMNNTGEADGLSNSAEGSK